MDPRRFFIKLDRLSSDPKSLGEGPTTDELRRHARRVLTELEQIPAGSSSGPGALQSLLRLAIASIFIAGNAVAFAVYALWRGGRWLALQITRPLLRS